MGLNKVMWTENAVSQIDDLLLRVCEELQLSTARYDEAVARYEAVAEWLEREGSAAAAFSPTMYPQGSMRLGTTVKPYGREEHDLDFVCEFRVPPLIFNSPLELLNLVERRLREHQSYSAILERKNRCLRLSYANEFHLDILPACPDPQSGGTCLIVPDRKSQCWKPSNPRGYAAWFEKRCEMALEVEARRVIEAAEPVPEQQTTLEKETLKRVVQLLKRWRDIRYRNTPDLAPISMILTTLAASAYTGQISVAGAMGQILAHVISLINNSKPRIYVLNPANPQEDLSERWNDAVKYDAFAEGIRELQTQWQNITASRGVLRTSQGLEALFGSPVNVALTKQATLLQEMREKSNLRVGAAGLITGAGSGGVAIRTNTFHGGR
jgi:Second Messenger Oligonucleotide or Dinucleotide Synthetase domain